MDILQNIHELPRIDKIKIMEFIWEELTVLDQDFESPKWHKKVLSETEERMKNGQEEVLDWDEAKRRLRNDSK
ncbi:MAG: addiction module protein [Deltaproteobacteria bacterium]|jgi:hypothetical protein|nr:addiction module protein [Deltaproteobacteria bacterium]MBT4089246.1 addiction module protein [Deltaproteobacteria bacterium]MBT4263864.1 addiction module protein [Deltaproteobacteria bacterium]MBT4639497.1 addiction module protein [Deltaproteobacteria bacterium]MBT6501934.1 addiction module protein [Deltaproteobacteria bacterium]